ncbi:MAG: LysM peptidoglycan-binding domain-containing protein [Acidobacteria bacterium]|nr:LysM peptidoglycan-binding domain-containing protein [Acidobacteriota bacterium]
MRRERIRRIPIALALLVTWTLVLLPVWSQEQAPAEPAPAPAAEPAPEPAPVVDGDRVRGYVPPPKNLKLVDGHWTPYDPPVPPEGSQVHVVKPADTLWDLAQSYYSDPYLWPMIWDANRYVTYSHWIYPGDPLVVPPKPTVVSEQGVPEPAPEPEPEPVVEVVQERPAAEVPFKRQEGAATGRAKPSLVPVAEATELLCSAQLYERFDPAPLVVSGREEPDKTIQGTGDIVYLSAGQDLGIKPGDEYVLLRAEGAVDHPETGKPVATFVRRLGRVRAIAVHANATTAEIITACDPVLVGDHLVPYRELPIPMVERIPLSTLATPMPSGPNGTVITTYDLLATIAGQGNTVGIDLGHREGLTAGDRVLFWRPGESANQPRRVVAQGIVLVTQGGGSTVKIIESRTEVRIGDKAEVL